jgi:AcrR family transcriptional regulator
MQELARKQRTSSALDRRTQILDEAIEIIGAGGYHAFVLQDLAKRCGITNGGVLYHFPSKERLLIAVLEERDRRLTEEVIEAFGTRLPEASLSVVHELLRSIVKMAVAQPALARLYTVLQAEALDTTHPAHDYFVARERTTLDGFAALVAPHVADPPSVARQIHALMDGLTQQWLRAGQGFDLEAAWNRMFAALSWPKGGGAKSRGNKHELVSESHRRGRGTRATGGRS